jgi:uroporphyrinogen III methyltransferase / synthase
VTGDRGRAIERGAGGAPLGAGRPLLGKTVVVTRPREQAAALAEPLEHLGARVLLAPTIRIVPRPWDDEVAAAVAGLGAYRLVIFTSRNGVDIFLDYLADAGLAPAAAPGPVPGAVVPGPLAPGVLVAAVGPATASALEERGVACDVVPDEFIAEGLVATLEREGVAPAGTKVLLPTARRARPVLPDALRAWGAEVDVLAVYDTAPAEKLELPLGDLTAADFITFTSGSTAEEFAGLLTAALAEAGGAQGGGPPALAGVLAGVRLCSIGPATSAVLRELGLPVAVEAPEHTAAGLVAAVAAAARPLA